MSALTSMLRGLYGFRWIVLPPVTGAAVMAMIIGALVVAPRETIEGDVQRLLYIHFPSILAAYGAFAVVFVASLAVLFRRLLKPGGLLVIGDVIPLKISALTDVLTLLRFGAQKGFFWAAVRGLFRTFFSDYRRLRQSLGLTRYDAAEILAKLEQAGFSAEPAPSNIGHNESRNSFLAHAR